MTNSNPFFSALSGMQSTQNLMNMYQQFRANPAQFLLQNNINVPQNISKDPSAIMNYLLQTGRLSQAQVNGAYQAAQQFKNMR